MKHTGVIGKFGPNKNKVGISDLASLCKSPMQALCYRCFWESGWGNGGINETGAMGLSAVCVCGIS